MTIYRDGHIVPPTSRKVLRMKATAVRKEYGIPLKDPFPIVHFLECTLSEQDPHFSFEVVEACRLQPTEHARTTRLGNDAVMMIREDVYDGACNGLGRDRFTLAHEFGHYLLHLPLGASPVHNSSSWFPRTIEEYAKPQGKDPRSYLNSEWQADAFAGELLMPAEIIRNLEEPEIVKRFVVSKETAHRQRSLLLGEVQRKEAKEKE